MKRTVISIIITIVIVLVIFNHRYGIEKFEGTEAQKSQYLEDMVKYLKIVVEMHAEREKVYPLSSGFGSPPTTFSSQRLTALEKQRQFFISKVKKDPQELAFFRENLTL